MGRLWGYGRAITVREVVEDLQTERSIAYTTVMTVMDNLHRKGLVSREMQGRAYRYVPAQTREQHTAGLMGEVLAGAGDRTSTLLHFLKEMSAEEVQRLRDALDEGRPHPDDTSR